MRRTLVGIHPPTSTVGKPLLTLRYYYIRGHRRVYRYNEYPTLSKYDYSLLKPHCSLQKRIEKSAPLLVYESKLCTLIFFLLCVGYYKKNRVVHTSSTTLQHGIGKGYWHACHSSFIPGIFDEKATNNEWHHYPTSLIKNTVLEHINNSTVLNPDISNEVTRLLTCLRKTYYFCHKLTCLLTFVSKGVYKPTLAMHYYFLILNKVIIRFVKHLRTIHHPQEKIMSDIMRYKKQGLFHFSEEDWLQEKSIRRILDQKPMETREEAYRRLQKLLLSHSKKDAKILIQRLSPILER